MNIYMKVFGILILLIWLTVFNGIAINKYIEDITLVNAFSIIFGSLTLTYLEVLIFTFSTKKFTINITWEDR